MNQQTMRTWTEIRLDNLEHNYHVLRSCAPQSKFLGVVKANAYGHGAEEVAHKLQQLGADYLAVACLNEATELRQSGITMPILILGATPAEFAPQVVEHDLTQAVFTLELAQALSQAAAAQGKRAKIHVKLDTGMSRLGILAHDPAQAARQVDTLCALDGLEAEGIFTHFANADGDEGYTMEQFTRFLDTLDVLKNTYGRTFQLRHCAASAAVLNFPCTHLDMVRPGIALYGYLPDPSCQGLDAGELWPVMTLKTRVAAVRELPGDTPVSYGCTQHMPASGGRVAVLPVGYADGLHRVLSGQGTVLVGGQERPIVGRVCMDMCMVALQEGDQVKPGDEVELFGAHHSLEDMAQLAGTIPYELLCAVSPRVPRLYRGA